MSIKQRLYKELQRHKWDLAIITPEDFDEELGLSKAHFIKNPYKNKWFADPFIFNVTDDTIDVLVEEYDKHIRKGRIARLSVSKKTYSISSVKILLELDTHLSFPAISRIANEIYIYPENSAAGKLSIYKYDPSNDEMTLYRVLVNKPLTDAVFYDKYIFATELPQPNGNILKVYSSDDDGNNYSFLQDIIFESNIARNGGDFFDYYGVIARPAQICDDGYGKGISLQSIIINDNGFCFRELKRFFPPQGYTGLHTYNQYKGYGIVDCRRYVHRIVLGFLHKLRHLV